MRNWRRFDFRLQSLLMCSDFDMKQHIGNLKLKTRAPMVSALHGMQARTSHEKDVCLSVCPSVKRVDCDKTEEKSVKIFIPYERSFSLVF